MSSGEDIRTLFKHGVALDSGQRPADHQRCAVGRAGRRTPPARRSRNLEGLVAKRTLKERRAIIVGLGTAAAAGALEDARRRRRSRPTRSRR